MEIGLAGLVGVHAQKIGSALKVIPKDLGHVQTLLLIKVVIVVTVLLKKLKSAQPNLAKVLYKICNAMQN